jgi:Rab-GTPase-TBC domain
MIYRFRLLHFQRVLKELVAEKLPQLHAHFTALQCDTSMFTFNWFLVLFVDNLPVEAYLRVWDTFLYEGNKV